jgi:hypothetical protein
MKVHKLLFSGLAGSAVLLAAGAAFSGSPATTSENVLVKYDQGTGELSGIPTGASGSVLYLHNAQTVHLTADIVRFTPPDPCLPFVDAWNATVEYDTANNTNSTFVFDILLSFMSEARCSASVTSTTGTPEPIVAITPTVH